MSGMGLGYKPCLELGRGLKCVYNGLGVGNPRSNTNTYGLVHPVGCHQKTSNLDMRSFTLQTARDISRELVPTCMWSFASEADKVAENNIFLCFICRYKLYVTLCQNAAAYMDSQTNTRTRMPPSHTYPHVVFASVHNDS